MNVLKKWLASAEAKCQVPVYELNITLYELESNEVALKAANTFPITYALLTHVSQFTTELSYNLKITRTASILFHSMKQYLYLTTA